MSAAGTARYPGEMTSTRNSQRHAVLITNPGAGAGGARCAVESLRAQIERRGYRVTEVAAGRRLARDLRLALQPRAVVVAAGGDGTLHLVANALALTTVPVCVVPCGTANDLANTLGIPGDPEEALDLLVTGRPRAIDLGYVNGHYFVNVASLGLSAKVAHAVKRERKSRWGRWAYVGEALRQARGHVQEPLRICVGSRCEFFDAYQVSVANGRQFGGGWRVTDEARPDDGRLDVVVVTSPRPNLHRMHGKSLDVMADRTFRAGHVEIDATHDVLANLDGEPLRLSPPLEFTVFPRALEVFAPEQAGA